MASSKDNANMTDAQNQKNKRRVWEFWQRLEASEISDTASLTREFVSEDIAWHGPDPIKELSGIDAFVDE